jgi:hypothetical protein
VPIPTHVGPYELLGTLGQGGMGIVARARHVESGAVRAVKVLGRVGDVRGLLRFQREAENLARVRHPNVVGIHEAGASPDGAPWFAMDLVEGRPLDQVLGDRLGGLPLPRALDLLAGIARGVAALHAAGIVHRDLKPSNVVVAEDGRPVVLDLGLALAPELDERLTKTGALVGTPRYLSPEQLGGRAAAPTTDVWALGLILHELVTGEPAVDADSAHGIVGAHAVGIRPRPTRAVPSLPAALDELVARCTARDPARRPKDAAAVLALVEALQASPGPSRAALTRRRRALALLSLAALAMAGGVVAATRRTSAPDVGAPAAVASHAAQPVADAEARAAAVALDAAPLAARAALADAWLARWPDDPLAARVRAGRAATLREAPLRALVHPRGEGALFADRAGARVVSWGADRTVRLWDVATGEVVRRWELKSDLWCGALVEAGRALLVAGPETTAFVVRLDEAQVAARLTLPFPNARVLAVAPDGGSVFVAGKRAQDAALVTFPAGTLVRRYDCHRNGVNAAAFLPDGARVATACGKSLVQGGPSDCAVRVLDAASGEVLVRVELFALASGVAVEPDGALLVCGNGPRLLRHAADGTPLGEVAGEGTAQVAGFDATPPATTAATRSARTTADGRWRVACTNEDKPDVDNELRVWDLTRGTQRRVHRPAGAHGLDVSADGRRALLALNGGAVEVWDLEGFSAPERSQ